MSSVEAWIATYPGANASFLNQTVESLNEQGISPHVVSDSRLPHLKWNEAIESCTSDYIFLPHHDDVYLPGYVKELSNYLDTHPSVVAVFCLDYLIDATGKRTGQTKGEWKPKDTYSFKDLFDLTMKHGTVLRCETVMFNRKVLGDMRFPDRSVSGTAHDTQFWFELAAKHPIGIVMKPLVKYRVHAGSDTQMNVLGSSAILDGFKARLYASTLRPQDVDFQYVIALTKHLKAAEDAQESSRVRKRQAVGCEFLVCHEPPDAAGTGVVVAHRVRTLNLDEDGRIRYYVYPVQGTEISTVWQGGVPAIRCPASAFGDIIEQLKPVKIEYHHLLRWSPDILNAPCKRKELWLHDSFLWCARYHSVMPDGTVCNEPTLLKCARCSGHTEEDLSTKKQFLLNSVKCIDRIVANSEYTAKYAKENLGVDCDVVAPSGEPLRTYGRRKRVGYFGGFGPVKGTPVLLQAWRMLAAEAQLLMFCDVPAEWLTGRKLAGFDDVLVMGGYNRMDLPDLGNLVDLAVVPSINESYGMVKREIEGLGIPVVSTSVGGLDGSVPGGDAVALAAAIRAAL